ncbi:MAG: hypothetical protein DMF67_11240 [Acidobacteria bacterium]|nr:MAG: hypothetical protein DMF66_00400 [Acidobacteriota bacterium]PYS82889.1 MAG: hypothetical protein DMF67_11240 [Acidobacteriota bacterium]
MTDPNKKPRDPETPGAPPPEESGDLGLKGEDDVVKGEDEVTPKVITDALTEKSDEVSLSAAKTIADAAEQVVVRLGIEKFIEQQWEKIGKKLDECDEYARAAATFGGDMIFISMAIPLVNGIIHVGSTRERLTTTTEWISKEWRRASLTYDPERIPVISALTLIYLITKGWKITKDREAAQSIEGPRLKLLKEMEEQGQGASQSLEYQELKKLKERLEKQLEELEKQKLLWERMLERVQRLCSDKASREAKTGSGGSEEAG